MSSSSRLCLLRYVASVCAFHLKVVLRRLEGVGGYVGEVVGGFCVWCVAVEHLPVLINPLQNPKLVLEAKDLRK